MSTNKKIFIDGPQNPTGNQLDVAIQGRGFLQVQLPTGSDYAYTRAGSLTLNEQGQLMMPNGILCSRQSPFHKVQPVSASAKMAL